MAADHHLLIGLLALQNGLIQQGQLVAAFHAWTCNKCRGLAEHLVARGDLDDDQRAGVEAMVGRLRGLTPDDPVVVRPKFAPCLASVDWHAANTRPDGNCFWADSKNPVRYALHVPSQSYSVMSVLGPSLRFR